jgi:hypothetical protein
MSRLTKTLVPAAALLAAGFLAAGCAQGGSVKSAVSSLSSRSASISPPTFSPGNGTPTPETSTPAPESAPAAGQPTVTSPAAAPAPGTQSQAATGSGSSLLWLWIVLAVLVIGVVAVLIARRSRRRSATAADWRSQVVDAYAKGSALYDAMNMAGPPVAQAADGEASARWADIQRRAGDLTQTLYALRENAPDETERARVADVLASLRAVQSALDAQRIQGGARAPQGARVHDLLLSFEASLRALRSPGEYTPYPPA